MMTDLSIVPAGAGAGKTYHIQKTLGEWVESGEVAPGRILAVTFTEAAAAEMRDRVRGELMARGRLEAALEIDRAYMGTIHALGQRLLTEHTFAAGRSPESRLLSEPERDLLIRLEMSGCAALKPLMEDLGRFGYAWNPVTQSSAEDDFCADLLRTVDLIRGLGERGRSPEILTAALQSLTEGYGDVAGDGTALTATLHAAVHDLLDMFPDSLARCSQRPRPSATPSPRITSACARPHIPAHSNGTGRSGRNCASCACPTAGRRRPRGTMLLLRR